MSEGRCVRVSVTLPEGLLRRLDEVAARMFKSRSRAVAEAVRRLVSQLELEVKGKVIGIVSYRYSSHHASERLRELGHHYLDLVVSTLHVHATEEECLEVVVVKGRAEEVKKFVEELGGIAGVRHISVMVSEIREGLG